MYIHQMGRKLLQKLFLGYLKFLERTVTIEWREDRLCGDSQIFGFWHEDSFFMNLVLKQLSGKTAPVDVIVTADTRGDYIENMIGHYGGHALRVPDGLACMKAVKKLIQKSYEESRSLAVSLDGPLGPRHEPKKLAFFLSKQRGDDFVGIAVSYSSCIRMFWRWDQYVIPLPFTTVTVDVRDYGEVDKRDIPDLPVDAGESLDLAQPSGYLAEGMAARKLVRDSLRYTDQAASGYRAV